MLQPKKSFWGRRPGFDTGDLFHIAANLGFSIVLGAMVLIWQLTPLAMVLVILSKWRVFAVQPRFWIPNIKANLVDIVVGISSVGLMHQAQESSAAYAWVLVYVIWLLFIKPKSSDLWVSAQGLVAQTLGLTMLFGSTDLVQHSFVVSLLVWVVAWSAARHYFSNFDEPHYKALSLAWAFLVMQTTWFALHWLQYYEVGGVLVASVVVFLSIISVTLGSLYQAHKHEKLTRALAIENTAISALLLIGLLISLSWRPTL